MSFDKDSKDFFGGFGDEDNNKNNKDEFDFGDDLDFGDDDFDDFDDFGKQDNSKKPEQEFNFDDDEEDDFSFGNSEPTNQREKISDFSFDDVDDDFGADNSKTNKGLGEEGNEDKPKGKTLVEGSNMLLDKLLSYTGLSEDSTLYKVIKYGIYIGLILFIVFFVFGYLIIGNLFGNNDKEEVSQTPVEETSALGSLKTTVSGIFGETSNDEGINNVSIEGSYDEKYLELAQNNVFRYKQPVVLKGVTFKVFNVEPYEELTNEDGREFIKVGFGIKNESDEDVKFTEYDFKLYTKQSLESKNTSEEGYIGINEENKSINVNVDGISESLKGLFQSQGVEPVIIRLGENGTSIGKGVVKPDEVYDSYVVFEVVPGEDNEYILGYNPSSYPFEILTKTYE